MKVSVAVAVGLALAVTTSVKPAVAESDITVGWHGLRVLGLSVAEQQGAEDVVAGALSGLWFDHVEREDRIASRCGNNVTCHCDVGRTKNLRYVAFGTAGRIGNSWSVELSVVETHACTVAATARLAASFTIAEAPERLRTLATNVAREPGETGETALKSERDLAHTPAIVSTTTAAELRANQITTLEDVFTTQAGFDILDTNWGAIPLAQGIRNTVLLVVDGIPQINNQTHLRAFGRDARVSLRNVERVEFVRGPGSVIWGPNAFLGVVNIITRGARSNSGKVDAGIELGSSDSETMWVNGAQARDRYAIAVSVDAGRRRGLPSVVKDSPFAVRGVPMGESAPWGNSGVTEPVADRWLDVGVKFDVGGWLNAMFKNQSSVSQHEISIYGPKLAPGDEGFYDKTWRTYSLGATKQVGDFTLTALASRFEFYSWENFAIQPVYPDATESSPVQYQEGWRSLQGNPIKPRVTHQLELRANHFSGYVEGGWKNQLLAGIDLLDLYSPKNYATQIGADREPAVPNIDFGAKRRLSVSLFGVDEWSPYPWIVLSGGARVRVEAPVQSPNPPPSKPAPPVSDWQSGVSTQAGAVVARDSFGAKLIFSEGYRLVDGNALFSTSGVKGDPGLSAERSREIAGQVSLALGPVVTASLGGNVTRLFNLVGYKNISEPDFTRAPVNGGTTDLASGFAELRATSEYVDAIARYGVTGLKESDPIRDGIPISPHNIFASIVGRPVRDTAIYARGTANSPRNVLQLAPTAEGYRATRLPWNVRLNVGGTISNVLAGFDIDVSIDNPFGFTRHVIYEPSGDATFVEDRTGTEFFVTLRWNN